MLPPFSPLSAVRRFFNLGLEWIEFVGLAVIGIATAVAMADQTRVMWQHGAVSLTDLLQLFLFLEVLAMIGQYFKSGQLPVRFPLYIGMVALARYLILDLKELTEWRMLAVSGAILLLALGVLIIRFGHIRYPYSEERATHGRTPTPPTP